MYVYKINETIFFWFLIYTIISQFIKQLLSCKKKM